MMPIDLTPFGFTPTENRAYGALLELGPSSGYALAKALSIARANAYQALNGLVAKGGAIRTHEAPQRYRAERPDARVSFANVPDTKTLPLARISQGRPLRSHPSQAKSVQHRGDERRAAKRPSVCIALLDRVSMVPRGRTPIWMVGLHPVQRSLV